MFTMWVLFLIYVHSARVNKGKGKVLPRTGHEGPEGEQMYSSTLPSTSALDVGGWSTPRPGRFNRRKDPVPIVQEAGWAPGPVWTGAENLASTGIRPTDRPARSESLYRLQCQLLLLTFWCLHKVQTLRNLEQLSVSGIFFSPLHHPYRGT